MWHISWIDKSGRKQTAVVATKELAEMIFDNLENVGIDPTTFTVRIE